MYVCLCVCVCEIKTGMFELTLLELRNSLDEFEIEHMKFHRSCLLFFLFLILLSSPSTVSPSSPLIVFFFLLNVQSYALLTYARFI